jgi:hypothetical protein
MKKPLSKNQPSKMNRSTLAIVALALLCTAGFIFLIVTPKDKNTVTQEAQQATTTNNEPPKSADDPYNLQITDAETIEKDSDTYTPPPDKPSARLRIDGTPFEMNNSDYRLGKWLINGNQVSVELLVGGIQASDCTLTQTITPDNDTYGIKTNTLKSVASQRAKLLAK